MFTKTLVRALLKDKFPPLSKDIEDDIAAVKYIKGFCHRQNMIDEEFVVGGVDDYVWGF